MLKTSLFALVFGLLVTFFTFTIDVTAQTINPSPTGRPVITTPTSTVNPSPIRTITPTQSDKTVVTPAAAPETGFGVIVDN